MAPLATVGLSVQCRGRQSCQARLYRWPPLHEGLPVMGAVGAETQPSLSAVLCTLVQGWVCPEDGASKRRRSTMVAQGQQHAQLLWKATNNQCASRAPKSSWPHKRFTFTSQRIITVNNEEALSCIRLQKNANENCNMTSLHTP